MEDGDNVIYFYYHNGSGNHGCEAIVRATCKILENKNDIELCSRCPNADIKYRLNEIVTVTNDVPAEIKRWSVEHILVAIARRGFHTNIVQTYFQHKDFLKKIKKGDICFSIGGDNYCYSGRDVLGHYNKIIHMRGGKTVLWGCSFDPQDLTAELKKDIAQYDLITARETISYQTLKKYNPNTYLVSDPAFQLDCIDSSLPEGFDSKEVVGINLSPLIMKCENIEGITRQNYEALIKYILDTTEMKIALIPHVVIEKNDDRDILWELYEKFADSNRICVVSDRMCSELKGIISKCRFFVGARTHATIAAYSTGVPTLVVGYSVKARGIAKDIFGTDENYVIPVQSLKSENDLVKAFEWLRNQEEEVKSILSTVMPNYKVKANLGRHVLKEVLQNGTILN